MVDDSAYRRFISVIAGFLDPQTRADEVRIVRARLGLPVGMGMKPYLERKRANGTVERLVKRDD